MALIADLSMRDLGMRASGLKMMLLSMDPPKVLLKYGMVSILEISMLLEYLRMFLGYSGNSVSPIAKASSFLRLVGKRQYIYD